MEAALTSETFVSCYNPEDLDFKNSLVISFSKRSLKWNPFNAVSLENLYDTYLSFVALNPHPP